MSLIPAHEWGLKNDIVPRFGARLVQEGNRLHYLADRAGLTGNFTPEQLQALERSFPALTEQLENLLRTGELNPRQQHLVAVHFAGFTCIADTCGSCGYVYITIYL
ncbi:type IV toxin-antitoxin system YeeU family antitoxin [Yersinia enterocolitica]|uniref:Antitoxin YeeU n=1 Tax=Yersinia massiliensis TaxID=419257 RepID=A0ABM6UNT6_9GAMM|nr:type IV toxin-antitoxin system YeeU family antitoxin [Yersinia massiliensis]AVX36256.1 antitoxin YeeU [Yersinia massiliensis]QKJ11064.1 type IV toxin-antitoxin system YeeU family antitoxin [Yersinia massiliensis]